MEVCHKCGRIIEEGHICSKSLTENKSVVSKILKNESQEALLSQMKKLDLNSGDLLLFSYDSQMTIESVEETGNQIVAMIEEYKDAMVPVIFLPDNFRLQGMSKKDLGNFLNNVKKIYEEMNDEE